MGAFVPFSAGNYVEANAPSPVNTISVQICDDQNEGCGVIERATVDDTITHVFVVSGAKNVTPADDTWTVSVQSVSNGLPNGILGGGSPASATFPNSTYPVANWGTNTGFWIQLANSIAVQAGEIYAFCVQKTGATDATNFLRFNYGLAVTTSRMPYTVTANSAGTWAKGTAAYPFFMGWKSATAVYGWPSESITSNTFGTTTETGFSFTAPSAFGTSNTFGLRRVRLFTAATAPAAAGTMVASLYGGTLGSAAALQRTTTVDSDDFAANSTNQIYAFTFPEDTLSALVPGTKYGVGFAHSGAAAASIRSVQIDNATDAAAFVFGGLPRITRTLTSYPPSGDDTNTFTETTTELIVAEFDFENFVAAAGGTGGGIRIAGHGGLAA